MTTVYSYTIYHSSNAYLGTCLLRRALSAHPEVRLVRRPIFIPRERGVLVAETLGGRENTRMSGYHREDCRRWADRYGIPLSFPAPHLFAERAQRWARSPYHREELPARAFYAAAPDVRDRLDESLFEAAWVAGLDVNEPDTILWAARKSGIDGEELLAACVGAQPGALALAALDAFDEAQCPGVPTATVNGERFLGKDRVDWVVDRCRQASRVSC